MAHGLTRKPRRDRTRRGAGSETREVSGPRAWGRLNRWQGCLGPWIRLSKPEARSRPWLRRSKRARSSRCASARWRRGRSARRCLRSDEGTQRSRWFRSRLLQPCARKRRGAGGRHPRRKAPKCGAGAGDVKRSSLRVTGWSRAGRRAIAECAEVTAAEVGDGLTAMPLVFPAHRANGRRRT